MRDFAPNGFMPLSSGPRLQARPSYLQEFLQRTSPRLYGATKELNPAGVPFSDRAPLTQLLQVTLPCPAPVAVMLHAQGNRRRRFEPPIATSAEVLRFGLQGEGRRGGRFIVEWGVGEAHAHVFTDLTPGSLQIPSAIFVAVFAFLEAGDSAVVSASVMPDAVLSEARASYTSNVVTAFSTDIQLQRQAFARSFSVDFAINGNPSTLANVVDDVLDELSPEVSEVVDLAPEIRLDVLGNNENTTLARWTVPDTAQVNLESTPVPVSGVPLAGNLDNFTLRIGGLPNTPPVLRSRIGEDPLPAVFGAASFVQTIRI